MRAQDMIRYGLFDEEGRMAAAITGLAATLAGIYRYPVKGMTAEALPRAALEPGKRLAGDRRFAIAHGGGMSLDQASGWQPKKSFLMLMRDERLALLEARFEEASGVLTLHRAGKQVARGNLHEPLGRTLIEQFLAAFMKAELRGAPKLVEALDGGLTDAREAWLSLVNLASVRDLGERIIGREIDPLRFRANLYVDGLAPWRERELVGREIAIGPVRLAVSGRIKRCAAVNVNPATGARDVNVLRELAQGTGHEDIGVYAEVLSAGPLLPGAALTLPPG
ncbi:MAG: MOSC domain-containing protein [Alphaproteobacteria bacterium]